MAQIITARLARIDSQPWGFRLQGGKDFGTPLVIQKVHTGSIADKAGLQAGDAVVRINQTDLFNLRHKDAQDAIVQSGPSFELVVQRGGATWKPTVTPISSAAASPIPGNFTPVTKTSLAANKQPVSAIGTGHNTAARPFVPPSPVRSIVNKQYNSPVAMYSEETIAETLTSQAEVLAGGCLGVNFKKNEKVYNPEKSEVLKALQENDSEPEPVAPYHQPPQPPQQIVTKHVTAPFDKPPSSNPLPPGQNICADCERLIVGVFVRIKDKNLHVECFKCATCGSSLKNQGYYNLHNKLYCDVHARLAAMNSPPPNSNGLVPVAIPPKNLGASTISSALNAHAGNLNGNHNINESQISPTATLVSKGSKVNDDNNNNIVCDNRYISETDCSSISSSDKENDSRPSSSHGNNINKSDITNGNDTDGFHYRTINGRVIKSVIAPGKGIKVNYKVPSNISGPKPFSYTQAPIQVTNVAVNPPMAAPKSPSSYPPPNQPTWAPQSAAPVAPKAVGPVQANPITNNKESMIATDLLKESVDRLNINSQNSDFRKNASSVLAAMLEARMVKKQQNQVNKFEDPEFLPPPPPLPSTKPPNPINHDQDLPLPPPPSPCKIPLSILTPPLSSDENDLPQKKSCGNNNNNTEKVTYRHKKHHHSNNQSPDSSPSSSTSSFHGISKPELSIHARDRRSYIEKNNNNTNGHHFNGNEISFNNSVDKDTLDTIANDLANGQNPVCDKCKCKITRGPFVTALGRTWCPAHFLCVNQNCRRELMDIGFVEEKGDLYCEYCFEQFLAPPCSKCNGKIKGDCLNAIGRKFHPECFKCTYCSKLFGNNPFFLEEGEPYCEADWNELFTTKCFACGFPVEAGDRWVEALNNNYHSQCFNCTYCKKNLEGQSFFAKGGRPFCKNHAR